MAHHAFGSFIAASLLLAGTAHGQKIEALNNWDVGDTATYKWTIGAKVLDVEEVVIEGSATEARMTQRTGDRTYDLRVALPSMAQLAGPCLANGQQCSFEPAIDGLPLPLEKGKKWNVNFTVKGETFTVDVVQERVVEKIEKVRTPAGEFDAWKIAFSSKLKGKDAKGASFSGKEDGATWFTFPGGKPVLAKFTYRNSFGEKATRDLVKLAYK